MNLKVMIMNLKMCTTGKIFSKIYLKAIRNGSREGWGEAWRKRGGLNFLMGRIRALPSSSLSCKSWSPIKSTLSAVLGLITIIILKRVRERVFSFKATNLQHVRLEMEKRKQNLWWCSIYISTNVNKCFSVNTHLSVLVTLLSFT